jgi:hypothetical protein
VTRYAAFGFTIESAIELPELDAVTGSDTPDWRIRTGRRADDRAAAGTRLGSESVDGDVQVCAYASGETLRVVFDDTGGFDVHPDRREIVWYPGPRPTQAAVRADLLGRVMALAAHADGHLPLHASAVSIAGRAVAIVGAKHSGKSTLALALVRHGARLLTDDTLVVRLRGVTAWASPGIHRIRLWEDAARALGTHVSGPGGAKPVVSLAPNEVETREVPLAACYFLGGSEPNSTKVRRAQLSAVHAAIGCVRFSKLGALGGGSAGVTVLDRAGTLTKGVPLFLATVPRDLARLDAVAEQFMTWHEPARVADPAAVR